MAAATKDAVEEAIQALTPGASAWDVGALIARREELGRKFTAEDLYSIQTVAKELAERYARNYDGDFCFMLDMKASVRSRGVSIRMASAILNCWYNDVRGIQINSKPKPQVLQPQDVIEEGLEAVQPTVEDGYYTFTFEDGSHLTVRVRVYGDDPRVQKIAALTGPDNEHDYQPFGFLRGSRYIPFSAYRTGYDRWHFVARAMVNDLTQEQREAAGKVYAQRSGNCMRCGRTLTDPVSIALGIGPTCRGERS